LDLSEIIELLTKFPSVFKRNKNLQKNFKNFNNESTISKVLNKSQFLDLCDENKEYNELEDFKMKIKKTQGLDSVILETDELYQKLRDLCKFEDQKWKLIYRASRDGFGAADFHERCDNIQNTLTIIKTKNSSIFGGFSSEKWSDAENKSESEQIAYIFSLVNTQNKPLLIKCSNPSLTIKYKKHRGPCFGDGDIKICDESNTNSKSSSKLGASYNHKLFEDNPTLSKTFLAGTDHFRTSEIEVYCKDYKLIEYVNLFF
jgi:hypothetical protein